MRLIKLTSLFTVAALALSIAACGGGGDDDGTAGPDAGGGDDDDDVVNPAGTHTQYVTDSINMPTTANEAQQLGIDLDGDPTKHPDNALGGILSVLASTGGVDVQASVDTSVDQGNILILFDVQATALTTATGVGYQVYLGANPQPAPCTDDADTTCRKHLDGNGTFDLSPDSPHDALLVGQIVGGQYVGGPGTVQIELSLIEGADPLRVRLIGARSVFNVTADNLTMGKLGGAITDEELNTNVLPSVLDLIQGVLDRDCLGTEPGACCEDDMSTGQTLIDLFDTDPEDCMITLDEVKNNDLISSLLAPDVDLLDADGNYAPRVDGIKDSLSLGVGFTAVGATFSTQ